MIFQSSTNNRMAKECSAFLSGTWCSGKGQKMDFPNSDRWETIAAKWNNKTKQKTQGINKKANDKRDRPKKPGKFQWTMTQKLLERPEPEPMWPRRGFQDFNYHRTELGECSWLIMIILCSHVSFSFLSWS
jgi:hypothetical protein